MLQTSMNYPRTLLALVLLFHLHGIVFAQPRSDRDLTPLHDTQAWLQVLGIVPVGERTLLHLEGQPRWNEDAGDFDSLLLRAAVGWRAGSRATAWGGYAYVPRFLDGGQVVHEHRWWEQLLVTLPPSARWTPSVRVRVEQRIVDQWADASHRIRGMVRGVRPIGGSRWSVAVSDEYFHTVDDTAGGPRRGFDQNRAFGGVTRRFSPAVTLEVGYLWQYLPSSPTLPRRHNHTALAWLMNAPPAPRK